MARIPTVEDLRRTTPRALRPIVRDQSGAILAEGLGDVAQGLTRIKERNDRFTYAKARSALLQADIEARRSLEADPDWANHETKYRDAMKKARETASGMIRDPADRAYFEQETGLDIDRGAFAVHGIARQKEGDQDRADLDTLLQTNRAAALNARDEPTRTALFKSTFDALKGAATKGSISQDAGNATWLKWQAETAEGYVAMLPAADRIAMLNAPKGTIADLIQPDQRVLLLRAAQNEDKETRVRGESQRQAEAIFAAGGSLEAMRKKARALEDPEVEDATVARLEARFQDREDDRNRYDEQNRRAAWDIIDRTGDWDQVPESLAARMNPQDRVAIKNYLKSGGQVKTDIPTWYALTQKAGEDPAAFASEDLLKFKDRLGGEDFQQLAALQGKIKEDVRAGDPIQTDNQIVAGALRELRIDTTGKVSEEDAQRAGDFRYAFQRAVNDQLRATGKQPSAEDKERIKDQLMIRVVTERGLFSDTTKPLFEADQVLEVVVPPGERAAIIAALKKRGMEATEERIQMMYLRGKGIQ